MSLFSRYSDIRKDDWVRLLFTETINPHPSLSSCRSTIFSYLYHSFIRVYNMIIRKFLLHTVVYIAQIPYRSHDHPTAQSLRWKKYFTVLNLFWRDVQSATHSHTSGCKYRPQGMLKPDCSEIDSLGVAPVQSSHYPHLCILPISSKLAGWNPRRLYTLSESFSNRSEMQQAVLARIEYG